FGFDLSWHPALPYYCLCGLTFSMQSLHFRVRVLMKLTTCFSTLLILAACAVNGGEFVDLFPEDGIPKGWLVRNWDNIKNSPKDEVVWKVQKGVLHGSEPRGTWLISEKEYGDFLLEFEWKLGERGNSGTALRAPLYGDPAFDGLELQMVDPRYYPPEMTVTPAELTGSLYKAVAPNSQF